jgi:hypothetical protein
MLVKVTTVELATGAIVGETNCNILRANGRKWLDKHMIWCFNNGHGLQMLKLGEKEPENASA